MNDLQSLGLELPDAAYIIGSIIFGLIGFVAFRQGRKRGHKPYLWLGLVLMLYPYLISNTWLLYAVGVGLCVALALLRE
jgi:hypothetical protein